MALRKYKCSDGIKNKVCKLNVSDEMDRFKKSRDMAHDSLLTEHAKHEQLKSDKINMMYDQIYRLELIDTNECVMTQPPQLKRSINNCNNIVNIFDITILEHMINRLEHKLTDIEKIEIYESRLNKLEEYIIQRHQ
jgi:hypothetical protein